jgi:hypothetical protein
VFAAPVSAQASGQPPAPQPPQPLARKRTSPVPAIIVAVCTLGIIAIIIVGFHAHLERQSDKGDQAGGQAETPAAPPAPRLKPRAAPDTARPPARPPPGAAPEQRLERAPDKVASDPHLLVTNVAMHDNPTGSNGVLTAELRNRHDEPVQRALVQMVLIDAQDRPRRLAPVTVRYIPPKAAVRFSVAYSGMTSEQVERRDAVIPKAAVRMSRDLVCLSVESFGMERADDRVVVRGSVRNTTDSAVVEARVTCDFFTDENEHVGTATSEGIEDPSNRIDAGKTGYFAVEYELKGYLIPSDCDVRLIGRRSL